MFGFAAAYTMPGGPNQTTGFPLLLDNPFFVVFIATDILSLAFALTSVVMFLSILASPYHFDDFRHSLPNKLMLGVTLMFLSVFMMMIAFAATILLVISFKKGWTKTLLYFLSLTPVVVFALPSYFSLKMTCKYFLDKITQAIPWSTDSCNRPPTQLTDSKHKSERDDFYTSHFSV
jgi:hypothetical protein